MSSKKAANGPAEPDSLIPIDGANELTEEEEYNNAKTSRFNPLKRYLHQRHARKMENEKRLLAKEELMKQDIERFLMEIEDRLMWASQELNTRNLARMKREEAVNKAKKLQREKERKERETVDLETGLSFYRGAIHNYKKFANSPAKHQDIKGHKEAVYSCKISPCLNYIFTASGDTTARLWKLSNGRLQTVYAGHQKAVFDCAIHPTSFSNDTLKPCLATCSGDKTIKLWNTRGESAVRTVPGHTESVYRVNFSPNGQLLCSCSEDKTVRTWCFPEGYLLYIFRGHKCPVIACNFSPTGRYLVSGSDYGERRVILWNASMPTFDQPVQYPHMIFWTPEGLVKKILIRRTRPPDSFWLTPDQTDLLPEGSAVEAWAGELDSDEEMDTDSDADADSHDGEEEKEKKAFGADDVRDREGLTLSVFAEDEEGRAVEATEYIPGHKLSIRIQGPAVLLSQIYIAVYPVNSVFDIFSATGGRRIGCFARDQPVPWEKEHVIVDPSGFKKPRRRVPEGLLEFAGGQAVGMFQRFLPCADPLAAKKPIPIEFGVVWSCPGPEMGDAVVRASYKVQNDDTWRALTYSLRESAMRMNAAAKGKGNDQPNKFLFDQEAKHLAFWNYIREKNWDGVYNFLDKKSLIICEDVKRLRRWRVVEALERMFHPCDGLVLAAPYVYKSGITRASVAVETVKYALDDPDADDDYSEEDSAWASGSAVASLDDQTLTQEEPSAADALAAAEASSRPATAESQGSGGPGDGGSSSSSDEGEDDRPGSPPEDTLAALLAPSLTGIPALDSRATAAVPTPQSQAIPQDDLALEATSRRRNGAISASDIKNITIDAVIFRPKTTRLELPEIIYTGAVEGKAFEAEIAQLAHQEGVAALGLRRAGISRYAAREVRSYAGDPERVEAIKLFKESPPWLPRALHAMYRRRQEHHLHHLHHHHEGGDAAFFPIANNKYVRSSRFGPDIQEFTMEISDGYPYRAGRASNALKLQLFGLKQTIKSINARAVPDSVEMAKDKERWLALEKKRNTLSLFKREHDIHKLEHTSTDEVGVHLLAERTYVGTRRRALPVLPGLSPHYPNELLEPCLRSYAKRHYLSDEELAMQLDSVSESAAESDAAVRAKDTDDDAAAGIAEEKAYAAPTGSTEHPPAVAAVKPKGAVKAAKPAGGAALSFLGAKHRDVRSKISAPVGHRPSQEELRLPPEAKEQQRAAWLAEEHRQRKRAGIPQDVFLERRGSFAFPPGLEPLEHTKAPLSHRVMHSAELLEVEDEERSVAASEASSSSTEHTSRSGEGEDEAVAGEGRVETDAEAAAARGADAASSGGFIRHFELHGYPMVHHGAIRDVVFSPSEARVASAGGDGIIKIWDPRDGSHVRSFTGHKDEVMRIAYTNDELYLVSCGADTAINVWDLSSNTLARTLYGHSDVVTSISISPDCALIASSSFDFVCKTWHLTPRPPDAPDPPKLISKTDSTALLVWSSPPCFNLEPTAFHLQYRVGLKGAWQPPEDACVTVAPVFRSKMVTGLMAASEYQFRMAAVNLMGRGPWSPPSKMMETDYGAPDVVEQAQVVRIATRAITLYLYIPNPAVFGAASPIYEVSYSGAEKGFDDNPVLSFRLEDMLADAQELLALMDEFMKPKVELYGSKKVSDDGSFDGYLLSAHRINEIRQRIADDDLSIFAVIKISGVAPGMMYRFRVRGVNKGGRGPWSEPSYSYFTQSIPPDAPATPKIKQALLTSLTFVWHAPDFHGASIIGYHVQIQHTGKLIKLERTQLTYCLTGLLPGHVYRIRVRALNQMGLSVWSDWTDDSDSRTITERPELPTNPLAVSGGWSDITLETRLPYNNGAPITAMTVQRRTCDKFDKGDWMSTVSYKIPSDVTIVDFVDELAQQRDIEARGMAIAAAKESGSYNPFKKEKARAPNVITPEMELAMFKPEGSKIAWTVSGLSSNVVYEFRISFSNSSGPSHYSMPSLRAKTNKADPPGLCNQPQIVGIVDTSVIIEITVPEKGGAPINEFPLEIRDVDVSSIREDCWVVSDQTALDSGKVECTIDGFRPGGTFQVRIKAQNFVGSGDWSMWSAEIVIPERRKGEPPPGEKGGQGASPHLQSTPCVGAPAAPVAANDVTIKMPPTTNFGK